MTQDGRPKANFIMTPIPPSSPSPLCLLTVGEGDFSCSLAIMRAYHPSLIVQTLVATTLLPSRRDVVATYPQAHEILDNLQAYGHNNVTIIYGVDATKLHMDERLKQFRFDFILFHHPHLGYSDHHENDANTHLALRHSSLLAHYLHSATLLLHRSHSRNNHKLMHHDGDSIDETTTTSMNDTTNITPSVHLCLCGTSIQNWKLLDTIHRLGLHLSCGSPFAASTPLFQFYDHSPQLLCHKANSNRKDATTTSYQYKEHNMPQYKTAHCPSNMKQRFHQCQRGKRKGHWLGRYGYRHQPTFPNATKSFVNERISNSYHIFLSPIYYRMEGGDTEDEDRTRRMKCEDGEHCHVCGRCFENLEKLQRHLDAPTSIII